MYVKNHTDVQQYSFGFTALHFGYFETFSIQQRGGCVYWHMCTYLSLRSIPSRYKYSMCEHVPLLSQLTLVILGCAQRLFPVVACIQVLSRGVHSCLREHFFSCTHQPHSNLGFAFRHIPQLSLNA